MSENHSNERSPAQYESAIVTALEALDDKRQKKFASSIKTIYTFFLVGVTLVGILMTYLNATLVSSKDFAFYREAQTAAISAAIKESIIPITSRIGESNSQIAVLSSEIVNLQLKFIELNGKITGNHFVTSEKYNEQIQSLNSSIQELRLKVMTIDRNKDDIEGLKNLINKLAQQIKEAEDKINRLH
jgi:predicted RNase H-like nuclease (RuvC/YqgF family)